MHKTLNVRDETIAFHYRIDPGAEYNYHPHRHDTFYEIYYLVQGDCTFVMENIRFALLADSLVLIPFNTTHAIVSNGPEPVERYSIHFNPRAIPAEHRFDLLRPFHENKYDRTFYFSEISNSRLAECFSSLDDLDNLPEDIQNLYCDVILESILIHILTFNRVDNIIPPSYSTVTSRIVDHINSHITEKLTLDNIAAALYMNKDYLNREFKKNFGISIKEYVLYHRVRLAQDILHKNPVHDVDSLTAVAMETGFQSYSTFYRAFKKVLGYSPSDDIK